MEGERKHFQGYTICQRIVFWLKRTGHHYESDAQRVVMHENHQSITQVMRNMCDYYDQVLMLMFVV